MLTELLFHLFLTQFFIAVAILLGVLEKAFFVAEYAYVNEHGISSECEGRGRGGMGGAGGEGGEKRGDKGASELEFHQSIRKVERSIVLSETGEVRLFIFPILPTHFVPQSVAFPLLVHFPATW